MLRNQRAIGYRALAAVRVGATDKLLSVADLLAALPVHVNAPWLRMLSFRDPLRSAPPRRNRDRRLHFQCPVRDTFLLTWPNPELAIYGAIAANIAIAITKFIVAGITGSF